VFVSHEAAVELQVVHGPDVIATEVFQEEWMALRWARAYRERLCAQGWHDVAGVAGRSKDA
jgi:hypothetical protein